MNYLPHNLEIRVHKPNGSIENFVQNDPEAIKRIVNEFQPDQIFAREKVIIADDELLTSFPARQLTRIDLISEPSSHLIFSPGIVDAVELTEAEYHGLLQNPELSDQWSQKRAQDASKIVFLEVEMAGQQSIFLALEVFPEPPDDYPEAILRPLYPLTTPTLCFRMRNGGISVLNLTHLIHFVLFPASQQIPAAAWLAYRTNDPRLKYATQNFHKSPPLHSVSPPNGRETHVFLNTNHSENTSTLEDQCL